MLKAEKIPVLKKKMFNVSFFNFFFFCNRITYYLVIRSRYYYYCDEA